MSGEEVIRARRLSVFMVVRPEGGLATKMVAPL
jgi:hypothetical protein